MINHTLNKQVIGNFEFLINSLKQLDPTQRWQVKVSLYKSTRSIEQNSRLWAMYNELGHHIGHSVDEVHELMGYTFLRELKTIGGKSVEVIKSTTKLNVTEMKDYQDNIERWASDIGFIFSVVA